LTQWLRAQAGNSAGAPGSILLRRTNFTPTINMLRKLKELFDSLADPDENRSPERDVQLATAVLLLEVMRVEPPGSAQARDALQSALQTRFGLSDAELHNLLRLADREAHGLYDYHRFTSMLNDHLAHPQKIAVVESMWTLAYADAQLDPNETHLIGKVAGLLHVTQGEYIAAKMRAKESAGLL
jgi:uncharacterized tellurite resistance protein B-like protein